MAPSSSLCSVGRISSVRPLLFLSGSNVLHPAVFKSKGVTAILNVSEECPALGEESLTHIIAYKRIACTDSVDTDLSLHFDSAVEWIAEQESLGRATLVHCMQGVSRSPTICIAYLMKHCRMSLRDAHRVVRNARPIVRPNNGFWQQLIDYEQKITGKTTVYMVPLPSANEQMSRFEMGKFSVPDVYIETMAEQSRSVGNARNKRWQFSGNGRSSSQGNAFRRSRFSLQSAPPVGWPLVGGTRSQQFSDGAANASNEKGTSRLRARLNGMHLGRNEYKYGSHSMDQRHSPLSLSNLMTNPHVHNSLFMHKQLAHSQNGKMKHRNGRSESVFDNLYAGTQSVLHRQLMWNM